MSAIQGDLAEVEITKNTGVGGKQAPAAQCIFPTLHSAQGPKSYRYSLQPALTASNGARLGGTMPRSKASRAGDLVRRG